MCVRVCLQLPTCSDAGTFCHGPACRFEGKFEGKEGSNIVAVAVQPRAVGAAVSARIQLKLENVQDGFSHCEDMVISVRTCATVSVPGVDSDLLWQKVCLGKGGLGRHWDWQQTKDLRESLRLQWLCLKNSDVAGYTNKDMQVCKQSSNMPTDTHASICCKWVRCLDKAGACILSLLLSLLDKRKSEHEPVSRSSRCNQTEH